MRHSLITILLLLLLLPCLLCGQEAVVMFYNVENFFDPDDDPATEDEEFTPAGKNKWTRQRLEKKRNAIAKTIIAAGEGNHPVLVGLCEVENYRVLQQLTEQTALARIGYDIVHRDSPDPRGIDVALLYRKSRFRLLEQHFRPITGLPTRDILYAKGVLDGRDTLHVLVNHWPSKRGGEQQSLSRRMTVARLTKQLCDSIFQASPAANVILMGDFNDTPGGHAIAEGLQARPPDSLAGNPYLYNLMLPLWKSGKGSYKYKGEWELIDLFFVSGNLLHPASPLRCVRTQIFTPGFLLTDDTTYYNKKPFRTYEGPRYLGGMSDHLPVALVLTNCAVQR